MVFFLLLLVLIGLVTTGTSQNVGVCYGRVANNLPSASEVIDLYTTNEIGRMRIYDPDQTTLEALRRSNIDIVIGVPNGDLQSIATDVSFATNWVQNKIVIYFDDVSFRYIVVGNEIDPANNPAAMYMLPAIQNIYNALESNNLHNTIKVTTSIHMGLLGNSYPPSAGEFSSSTISYITPIINFLVEHGSPLLVNVYPYFAYVSNLQTISLDYALFQQQGNNDVGYQNLFDAQLDAVYAALQKIGASFLQIVVSESGWPSAGGDGATPENAKAYYTNLIARVNSGTGTLLRPNVPIETYLFAMFDENQKPGAETEQHFGVFYPDKSSKYEITFN